MDGWMMGGWKNELMNGQKDGEMDKWWVGGRKNGWMVR